jgi:Sec-independent protein translocase protein TatA
MFKLLIELFLFYLLYKFIFEFVIPIFRTTREVKKKMNEFQQNMNKQAETNRTSSTNNEKPTVSKPRSDDYIDFEEIK